jgi:hypothetical protein
MIWVHNEVTAQNDTLIMNSGHFLVGEIKGFDEGVVTIETAFSDSDFHVEWDKVKNFSTEQKFLIITSEGKRYFGSLATDKDDPSRVTINDKDAGNIIEKTADIVYFKQIEDTFWSRADLSVSLGFTKTKANNNTQLSINVQTGYLSSNFKADIYFAAIKNLQEVDTIATRTNRTEGGLGLLYFVYKDWFSVTRADLLSSSEQLLNIRAITKAGMGRYVVKTNRMNLGIAAGVAWNFEDYDELDNNDRNSAEGFLAAEYTIFDLGDLDLNTKVVAYPSFTESGRFRTDFNFSVKYEFDFDLFFKVGYKLNYDNMPVAGGSSNDYVIETSIGWEL